MGEIEFIFTTGVVHKGIIYKANEIVPEAIVKDKALQIYIAPNKPKASIEVKKPATVVKKSKKKR